MTLAEEGGPSVVRLWGITVQDLAPSVAESLGTEGVAGVLVSDAGASASTDGLRRGDVIVRVDDVAIASVAALRAFSASAADGHRLDVRRGDVGVRVQLTTPSTTGPRG